MPPSSSSSNKKKGDKTQEPQPKAIDDDDEEKKLAEAFAASTLGRKMGLTDERLAAVAGGPVPPGPDNPPCDGCARPFGGTMLCSRCGSAFYCCRDCQASHWTSKHKAECTRLKQQNEETAKGVLCFFGLSSWRALDLTATYKAAVRFGLHDKIREVLELDKTSIVDRCRSGADFSCYTSRVMLSLFRGQRAEGRTPSSNFAFTYVDGTRIKGYVSSHPDAFDTWLQASVQLLHAVLDHTTLRRHPDIHRAVHRAAHDVWGTWALVFTSPVACRAILAPYPPTEDGTSSSASGEGAAAAAKQRRKAIEDRARRIVTTLRDALRLLDGVPDPRFDPGTVAEAGVYSTAATVHLRLQEFRIGVDVEAILNLKGVKKQRYQRVVLPMAKRTIEKGSALNAQEGSAILAQAYGIERP